MNDIYVFSIDVYVQELLEVLDANILGTLPVFFLDIKNSDGTFPAVLFSTSSSEFKVLYRAKVIVRLLFCACDFVLFIELAMNNSFSCTHLGVNQLNVWLSG